MYRYLCLSALSLTEQFPSNQLSKKCRSTSKESLCYNQITVKKAYTRGLYAGQQNDTMQFVRVASRDFRPLLPADEAQFQHPQWGICNSSKACSKPNSQFAISRGSFRNWARVIGLVLCEIRKKKNCHCAAIGVKLLPCQRWLQPSRLGRLSQQRSPRVVSGGYSKWSSRSPCLAGRTTHALR